MIDLTNTWMNNPAFLSQSAHFFSAIAVIMTAFHVLGKKGALIVSGIFGAAALVKEYWYDLAYELPKQTFGDSTLDFTFYAIGIAVAVAILVFTNPKT